MKYATRVRLLTIAYSIIFWAMTIAFAKKIGVTLIYFSPLIYILTLYAGMFMIIFLLRMRRSARATKAFDKGDYKKAAAIGEKMLSYEEYTHSNSKRKRDASTVLDLYLSLAVIYFAENNDEKFLLRINNMDEEKYKDAKDFRVDINKKMFWLSLYYLQKSDFENARIYYDKIEKVAEFHTQISFLEGFKAYKDGDIDAAKEKMNYVYTALASPVLRHKAEEILSAGDKNEA